jgi:hypothetical protein
VEAEEEIEAEDSSTLSTLGGMLICIQKFQSTDTTRRLRFIEAESETITTELTAEKSII